MSNIPTANQFRKEYVDPDNYDGEYNEDKVMVEFAKLHVTEALKEVEILQRLKWSAGETGYLSKEDFELVYPLNNIK